MANGKKLIKILYILIGITFYNCISLAMAEKPYHHLPDGTFRNPEGSPVRSKDVKFSYRTFKWKSNLYIVPHLKALNSGQKILGWQRHGSTTVACIKTRRFSIKN